MHPSTQQVSFKSFLSGSTSELNLACGDRNHIQEHRPPAAELIGTKTQPSNMIHPSRHILQLYPSNSARRSTSTSSSIPVSNSWESAAQSTRKPHHFSTNTAPTISAQSPHVMSSPRVSRKPPSLPRSRTSTSPCPRSNSHRRYPLITTSLPQQCDC